ncbi:MAG: shikimate kinase [Nannocystis sp.]|uniref:shikimate kinase n=1 Tax=Nannocystis sp. TaxID=1962667 RepID=UPI002425563D|nr:shikimate kinase [Nannocystis sp.]MBK9756529.1 shikimate kinase [Nannocystis sp.]
MPRIIILGNSGSGKSTLARALAATGQAPHLDLDTLAWEPTSPPTRRPLQASVAAITRFMDADDSWVVEGCYADLLAAAAGRCTNLVFLNPGVETCLENCRARPWEPHKYPSPEAQDQNLGMLLAWVRDYETRSDEFSLQAHRRLFDRFAGDKLESTSRPNIDELVRLLLP